MPDENKGKGFEQSKFKPGQSGNPAGRPTGSRYRSTLAAEKLKKIIFGHSLRKIDTTIHGKAITERRIQLALTRVYNEDPKGYADIVLKAMPKNLDIDLMVEASWASMIEDANRRAQEASEN